MTETSAGFLSVLNIGAGDLKVSFDKDDPNEAAKAKRIIADMLKRGYLLFVETPEGLLPVKQFDASKEVYILADRPPAEPIKQGAVQVGRSRTEVPLRKAKAHAMAPTAGG